MSVSVDEQPFWLGDWKVEPTLNRISRGEEMVKIDPRNMRVLQLLASKPGKVFSQAEIEQAVWDGVVVTTNSVYQSITQLRKALGDDKDQPKYIETIARKGYRVIADVRPAARENTHERHSGTSLARTS
jgi:DNA-binding winged-HTH domains